VDFLGDVVVAAWGVVLDRDKDVGLVMGDWGDEACCCREARRCRVAVMCAGDDLGDAKVPLGRRLGYPTVAALLTTEVVVGGVVAVAVAGRARESEAMSLVKMGDEGDI